MIPIPGYRTIELVYKSDTSYVYRGYREVDQQPFFFKVLRNEYPLSPDLAQYRREYDLIRSVHLEGVIQADSLQKYQHTLVMILEDFGGLSLDMLLAQHPFSLDDFLTVAIQTTRTLGEIHRQNIVQKDITPANIVWNAQTNQLKLIDFGVATRLSRENPILKNPELIEGTLAYISPEQTGRMNRSIDYRSDYYSLGVTFYELLTGRLPFQTDDAMEMVHAHIADMAVPPVMMNPTIPAVVSDIVMKLMSKTAEKRYQSAQALEADLEECAKCLRETGHIDAFPIARNDLSDRFHIPETLYGRQEDIAHLLTVFQHVAEGNTAIVLYAGEPGSGKSALVHEVHKPIVEKRGYFIAGKYDQFTRHIPYTAIIQAFEQFVQQLLTESDARLVGWRSAILQGIGVNGQVLIDIIPNLELIIGPQPEILPLPPAEAQNRFQYVFQSFVRVISPKAHPLVLFIDDLQWADAASLNLLKRLTIEGDQSFFLLMGAYRNNEVDGTHPLALMIDQLRQAQVAVNTVQLKNLSFEHVNELTADTLYCDLAHAKALAEVVYEKTRGNAFFVTQFLKALYQEGLLSFDIEQRRWQWDNRQIQHRSAADNVIELMGQKLRLLPARTQSILALAACIGNVFDLETLALVSKSSLTETFPHLWPSIVEDLIFPLDDTYHLMSVLDEEETGQKSQFKFLHDRVQQAAYALIPAADQASVHLDIGRQLLMATSGTDVGETIFTIVNHLNQGLELITDAAERSQLAALNLQAGARAKLSTAYETALRYLSAGTSLLTEQSWETAYELTFALSIAQAECEYLLGHFERADDLFNRLLSRVRTPLEAAKTFNLMVILNTSRGNMSQTLQSGQRGLATLAFYLPDDSNEKKAEIGQALDAIHSSLTRLEIEELLNLPDLRDPDRLLIMDLCLNMIPTAIMSGDLDLYTLLALKIVNMSLNYGSAGPSSHAFIIYAAILVNAMKDYKTAYRFGRLGLALGEKYKNAAIEAKNNMVFACWVNGWTQHLETSLDHLMTTYQKGLESGDLFFASSGFFNYVVVKVHLGRNTDDAYQHAVSSLAFAVKSKDEVTTSTLTFYTHLLLNLRGETRHKLTLDTDTFDMEASLDALRQKKNWIQLSHCLQCKLEPFYLYGDRPEALKTARELETMISSLQGTIMQVRFQFFYALILSASYDDMTDEEKAQAFETLSDYQQQAKIWAEQCPENFALIDALMSAEMSRLQGDDLRAMPLYDEAIQWAHEYEYPQYEAMSYELAAAFYHARGQAKIAAMYMTEAHYVYNLCGMIRKAQDLEDQYPQWFSKNSAQARTRKIPTTQNLANATLDLTAILKASQAISSEINFDRLLGRLIHIAVENVGAESGYLILDDDGDLYVEAFEELDTPDIAMKLSIPSEIPIEQAQTLSVAIVRYVARTKTSLVLGNAAEDSRFASDPYIVTHQPKSVLCTPIVQSGKLTGVLYLENNLTADAFTPDQLEILNLLNTQMAISIENARLYRDVELQSNVIHATNIELQREVIERQNAEQKYRSIFENATEGIFQTTVEGRFIAVNPACARILGYESPEDLIQTINNIGPQLYIDPSLREHFIVRIVNGTFIKGHEVQLYRRDGSIIWALVRAQPIYDASGQIRFFEGSLEDVTERVRAEEALEEERSLLRTLIDNLPHYIYYKDVQAQFVIRNRASARMFGLNSADGTGHYADKDRYISELTAQYYAEDMAVIESGQPLLDREEIALDEQGNPICLLTSRLPIRGKDGQITGLVGIGIDITERKHIEQALRDSEESMRQLADGAFEGILIHDQGIILEANQAYCQMFGYERAEMMGKSVVDLAAPEYRELVQQKVDANDPDPYEAVVVRKDGTMFRVEVECRPIIYRGHPARIATIHDLTQRELAESRRLELALVNQKTAILKEFLNVMSHDLKTPLSIINISLYLLERITDPDDQRLKLEKIKAQTQRLEKLIQDILTVSRLDTVPDTVFNPLDLNRALREIHDQFEAVAEERKIQFDLALTADLPLVLASETELHRALINLVENALHYTPAGGNVNVRTLREADYAVVEVQDTGIGIDETDLLHVFEHFYRADKARATDTGGTGLGLAIVRKIIDLHGGTIEIESKLGVGSTFRARLPLNSSGFR